ncbi:Flp family type IVb pilin [uncultured Aureimonas sp.]|uniref:Flp family type IVb pilin n=1 Tax=uncultured Aureimonas sp. TaxID=1604662 RepID=UPI0025DB4BD6|nr:Flp family type IVb pilin [uncultured Aureimonas sp.]
MLMRAASPHRFLADRSGATAIEYGLIVALVGIALLVGLGDTRDGVSAMFNNLMVKVSEVLDRGA